MKRALFVLALAAVLVLSFSTVAFAKYAGYAYNNPVVGFVSGSAGATQVVDNPSPGYLSWQGANAISANYNGGTSTNGTTVHGGYAVNTTKCAVCHSAHRANSDATAAGVGSYWKLTPGGQACVACHTPSGANPVSTALVEWPSTYADGGPHSSFNCLSACHGSVHGAATSEYGAVRAFNLTNRNDPAIAAAFAAGNVASWQNQPNSASVISGGGTHGDYYYGNYGETEFRNNDYAAGVNPSYPTQNSTRESMRAMATGYTCGASGCHSSSQFVVNQNGFGEFRASKPGASTTLDKVMTGHSTNMIGGCGPCHVTTDSKCAGCHDMKGKATNSSAFPHANRNIVVVETNAAGSAEDTTVASGNLWMMGGDSTWRDAGGVPSAAGTPDPERRVVRDAAGFHDGHAGNINDSTCLKCHGFGYFGPNYGGPYHTKGEVTDFSRK